MRTEVYIQVVATDANEEFIREEFDRLAHEVLTWPEVDSVSVKVECFPDGEN